MEKTKSKEKRHLPRLTRGRKIVLIVLAVILLLVLPGLYNKLKVVHYEVESNKVSSSVRIVLVTDLHSCKYGKEETELIEAIDQQSPDIILLGGDIFDDDLSSDNTEAFLRGISGRYPIFYVTGNHEYWSSREDFEKDLRILEQYGIRRLRGETEVLTIRGNKIAIAGVDDPDMWYHEEGDFGEQLLAVTSQIPEDAFSILLTHRPELYESYLGKGFDLVLAGHAHGGQWRIPGILNGTFAPNQGLFPKYAGGRYSDGTTTMIVSRGLARESTLIPRIYDRPELVVIDVG
ncbi:MAG: metallophosphoesterase [Clostridiales bacterium]|nr:metallophosphoesterase [Clostridiales bacterium]